MTRTAGCWLTVLGFAGWAALRLPGLEWGTPAIQLLAFTPYAAAAAAVTTLACLLLGRRVAAIFALVTAVALASAVVPRAIGGVTDPPKGPALRVLTLNLMIGAADAKRVVALVREVHADVVAFQEFTPQAQRALEAAGLAAALPHQSLHPAPGAAGSALYSRLPITGPGGVRRHRSGFLQAQATLALPGGGALAVESAHPFPPVGPSSDDSWFADLRDQPRPAKGGPLVLLLGDFNSTLDHAALRSLLNTGYRDAANATGAGLHPTWPADRAWFPGVVLDHVLIGPRLNVRRVDVHGVPGTDHRAVFAEVVVPAR